MVPSRRIAGLRARISVVALVIVTACQVPQSEEPVWVIIPVAAPPEEIAESLATHDIVRSPGSFLWYAKLNGQKEHLKGGAYRLTPGMPVNELAARLVEGRPLADRMVIGPGLWVNEIAWYVERQTGISADSFKVAARDSTLRAAVGARGETLEGYLFPTSYYVRVGSSALDVVRLMAEEFESHWDPASDARLDSLGLIRDELLTIASIIEGEGPSDSGRAYISSVYHNRLARGMRLQADPTVVYALGRRQRLYNKDYQTRSPYNTYLFAGLPPAPINNPSAEAIEAALYPPETDYYFFVAGRDRKHIFSRSYREHLMVIRGVRRGSRGQTGQ